MEFDNHYYAEIIGVDGELATEVLVDPGRPREDVPLTCSCTRGGWSGPSA